jgi:hypothetical protein
MTTRTFTRSDGSAGPATWQRSALRWLVTFAGFPLGGLLAEAIAGPVDGLAPALIGGVLTGIVLGAVQAWALGSSGPSARRWLAATALGVSAGLAIGSAAVNYRTGIDDLAAQGAICGLAIGAAQAIVLRAEIGRLAYLWAPALSALWALGWTISTSIGVDVESRYTVFGASGALVVTAATAVLPALLAARATRSGS